MTGDRGPDPDTLRGKREAEPGAGDPDAQRRLFTTLYDELRQIAQRELKRSGGMLTLSATTLLHETYLKISHRRDVQFPDRAHFMAYASRAMRSLVIDSARSRLTLKSGAGFEFTALPTEIPEQLPDCGELERLSDAIEALALLDPALAQVVDLKFFCGLSFVDIAALRGVSVRTVERDWEKARILLHRSLREGDALL
jgi:RNA polymerase sigma factor (TIGR02999 family)